MSTIELTALSDVCHMEIDCRGQVAVVKLSGLVTMDKCDAIRHRLVALVAEQRITHLVFDLSDLEFVGSDGLGIMVGFHVCCSRRNGGVLLVSPSGEIRKLLEAARLTDLFTIYESVEAALADTPKQD